MKRRPACRPDLTDAVLEARIVPALTSPYVPLNIPPIVFTAGGYAVIATPLVFSASLGLAGNLPGASGPVGGNGGLVATSFVIFGFGMSVVVSGNSVGLPGGGTAMGIGTSISLNVVTGSGANAAGSEPVVSLNTVGQGPLPSATNFIYIGEQMPSVQATITPAESAGRLPTAGTSMAPPTPTPATATPPAIPGTITSPPAVPALSGTVPTLPGALPPFGPRPPR